ncbi:hypothetical protein Tco_1198821, partial [Tanacetum coccineum]
TRERTLAAGEIPLNDETVNMTVPLSAEIIQIVDHTILDELKEHAANGGKRLLRLEWLLRLKWLLRLLWLLRPAAGGKSPAALNRLELHSGPGLSSVPPSIEEFVSFFVTPTPEPDVLKNSSSTQDRGVEPHAEVGVIVAASARGIGASGNNVEAFTSVDNPALCQNLLDHVTPSGYWAALHNQSNYGFLDSFNINSA